MSTNPFMPGQSGRQDSTAYINELRFKRRRAIFRYNLAKTRADNIQAIIDAKTGLKNKLREYWDKIQQTDQLAQNVINTIDRYASLMKRVAFNAELTNMALKGLTIDSEESARKTEDIEDFFEENIKYPISCLTPAQQPVPNSPITAALNALETAIRDAMPAASDAVVKSLKAYQHTQMLSDFVGDQEGNKGLSKAFLEMRRIIHIDDHPGSKIHFPRSGCPDDRWDRTKAAYEDLVEDIARLTEIQNLFLQRANLAEDRKNAISVSLTAAEAAARS